MTFYLAYDIIRHSVNVDKTTQHLPYREVLLVHKELKELNAHIVWTKHILHVCLKNIHIYKSIQQVIMHLFPFYIVINYKNSHK